MNCFIIKCPAPSIKTSVVAKFHSNHAEAPPEPTLLIWSQSLNNIKIKIRCASGYDNILMQRIVPHCAMCLIQ